MAVRSAGKTRGPGTAHPHFAIAPCAERGLTGRYAPCEGTAPTRGIAVNQSSQPAGHQASFEFIALMAVMTSIIAFSIDAMLPALPQIAADLGVADVNDRQLVVIVLFIGLALAQIVYGPISDTIGRKPAAYYRLRDLHHRQPDVHLRRHVRDHADRPLPAGRRRRRAAHRVAGAGARSLFRPGDGEDHVHGDGHLHHRAGDRALGRAGPAAGRRLAPHLRRAAGGRASSASPGSPGASRRRCARIAARRSRCAASSRAFARGVQQSA